MFLDLLKTLLTLRVPLLCYTLPTTLQRTQTGGPPDTGHRATDGLVFLSPETAREAAL